MKRPLLCGFTDDDDTASLAARIQRSDYGGRKEPTERNNEAKRFERTTITTGTDADGHVIEVPIEAAVLGAAQSSTQD